MSMQSRPAGQRPQGAIRAGLIVCLLVTAWLGQGCGLQATSRPQGQASIVRLILPDGPAEPGAVVPVRVEVTGTLTAVHWSAKQGVFQDPRVLSTRYVCPEQITNIRDVLIQVEVVGPDGTIDRREGAITLMPLGPGNRRRAVD